MVGHSRLADRRAFEERHDPAGARFGRRPGCFDDEVAVMHDRHREDAIPARARDRNRFAREDSLVDHSPAAHDQRVDRDAITACNGDAVAGLE
jgi:hypothetical protein